MASLQDRVIGVLRLQASTFEEVEADASATPQAATIVVVAAISTAIGAFIATPILGAVGAVVSLCLALVGWVVGSFVLQIVGTKILPGQNTQADLGQVLRTTGFAAAPKLLGILTMIPILGFLLSLVIGLWSLVAMVIGVKAALDYDDFVKPIIVCVITWIVMWVIIAIPMALLFGAAMMAGAGAAR
jgi:hypothetical protein